MNERVMEDNIKIIEADRNKREELEQLRGELSERIPMIIPLLEEEVSFYRKDLITTEKNLEGSTDPELTSAFKEQSIYLKDKIREIEEEMVKYKAVLGLS
jgi:U3 small nucleolar ribonucleoprotein component